MTPAAVARLSETETVSRPRTWDIQILALILSGLISLWMVWSSDKINPDGALYIQAAQHLLAGDWNGAYQLYSWPFFPALIALTGRLTGLPLEPSAYLLCGLLLAILVWSFIALVREFGADRPTLVIAAFVILSFPYLNDNRAEIVRDFGYWACYLQGMWVWLRFYRSPSWGRALLWGGWTLTAGLFRIEGLGFLLGLPLLILIESNWSLRERGWRFLQLNSLSLLGLLTLGILLGTQAEVSQYSGRLLEPLQHLKEAWLQLSGGLVAKAELMQSAVLAPQLGPYAALAEDNAMTLLVSGLVGLVLFKLVKLLNPLYSLVLLLPRLGPRLQLGREGRRLLIATVGINLAILSTYVVQTFYLSKRFVMALAFTLLTLVPFGLADLYRRWRNAKASGSKSRWLYLVVPIFLLALTLDGLVRIAPSKAYVKEAGHWLKHHAPPQAQFYTNQPLVEYYADREIAWLARERYKLTPPQPLASYDYVAIELSRGRFPSGWEALVGPQPLEPVANFANRRQDGVRIFRVPH